MKSFKKVAVTILAAVMMLLISTTVFAADSPVKTSFNASLTWHPYSYYTDYLANSSLVIDLEKEWAAQNPNLAGNGAKVYAQNMLDQKIYTSAGICNILNYYAGNISESEMNAKLTDLAGKGYNYYDQMKKYAKRDPLYQQYNMNIQVSQVP